MAASREKREDGAQREKKKRLARLRLAKQRAPVLLFMGISLLNKAAAAPSNNISSPPPSTRRRRALIATCSANAAWRLANADLERAWKARKE